MYTVTGRNGGEDEFLFVLLIRPSVSLNTGKHRWACERKTWVKPHTEKHQPSEGARPARVFCSMFWLAFHEIRKSCFVGLLFWFLGIPHCSFTSSKHTQPEIKRSGKKNMQTCRNSVILWGELCRELHWDGTSIKSRHLYCTEHIYSTLNLSSI